MKRRVETARRKWLVRNWAALHIFAHGTNEQYQALNAQARAAFDVYFALRVGGSN